MNTEEESHDNDRVLDSQDAIEIFANNWGGVTIRAITSDGDALVTFPVSAAAAIIRGINRAKTQAKGFSP